MSFPNKTWISKEDALAKLQHYCAYQDRCHEEVRTKLLSYKIYGEDLEDIIIALIEDDFLNEERFARSYVRGKYRIKLWGRKKIHLELKRRKISPYCIKKGLEEIDEDMYHDHLQTILKRYASSRKFKNGFDKRQKLYAHAISKGYESEIIGKYVSELVEKK